MIPTYFKKAVGCICVYDITKPETFHGLDEWVKNLREMGDEQVYTVIGKFTAF